MSDANATAVKQTALAQPGDSGLISLVMLAGYYRIAADPMQLRHQLALLDRPANSHDLAQAAKLLGLRARILRNIDGARLLRLPFPALMGLKDGGYVILGMSANKANVQVFDPLRQQGKEMSAEQASQLGDGDVILITRRMGGPGANPESFGLRWFLPSLWRYRKPLQQVLVASIFIQIFALVTPIFFQLVVDKVLVHKSVSTLMVLILGLIALGFFEIILQYLRTYLLNHTTNRIDVELGRRLFFHLFRLPLSYFETRPAGQTVARVRELENIRNFLTGQGLTSLIDFVFTLIFFAVMFFYSVKLTLVVIASIPIYLVVAAVFRPLLKKQIDEKFNRGALSQQFLVESVIGARTLKAASVEPIIQSQWEERLAAYVRTSFDASMTGAMGGNIIQYISRLTTALVLLFGAQAVIEGSMTVGELIAFNMISGQVVQPILRLSQLWQDFQQVQVSIARLGDILNAMPEPTPANPAALPPPRGAVEFRNVSLRYRPDGANVVQNANLSVAAGEVIGIVGQSGSGKSTLTKLLQRLYSPQSGQILLDGMDIAQLDPTWLRRQIGTVLQENFLFNRTIHENIALANPSLPRPLVIQAARMSGADEFISQLPDGYDTLVEERGANLSGGQIQRLAIARALVTNPRILIFDEATSALDYESEMVIQQNMSSIVNGRTVFIIAHRLAAVRVCHRIVGMRRGEIVEVGSHQQLLANPNGVYARLWALQMNAARENS